MEFVPKEMHTVCYDPAERIGGRQFYQYTKKTPTPQNLIEIYKWRRDTTNMVRT